MTQKLTDTEIDSYAKQFAVDQSEKVFRDRSSVLGKDLLSLFPVQQLNLTIIRLLYSRWAQETENLKSPFFDFENTEVKESLDKLMIVLSRNIKIEHSAFKSLLEEAVKATLACHFEPRKFFLNLLGSLEDKQLDLKWIKTNKPYLKKYDSLFNTFEEHLQAKPFLSKTEAIDLATISMSEKVGFDQDLDLNELDQLQSFKKEELFKKEEVSFFEQQIAESLPVPVSKPTVEPIIEKVIKEPIMEVPVEKKDVPTVVSPIKSVEAPVSNLYKISSIKEAISLNQRFLFINNLFNGDATKFNEAISHLENLPSLTEAKTYLHNSGLASFNQESLEKDEFYELLNRKYPS